LRWVQTPSLESIRRGEAGRRRFHSIDMQREWKYWRGGGSVEGSIPRPGRGRQCVIISIRGTWMCHELWKKRGV